MPEEATTSSSQATDTASQSAPTAIGNDFNPFSEANLANPDLFFARARKEEPVFFSPTMDVWVVTRYADVNAALQDPQRFSSASDDSGSNYPPEVQQLLSTDIVASAPRLVNLDPPEHTRLRQSVNRAFTPQRVASLAPTFRHFANRLIDQFIGDGQADFVLQFAHPYPKQVIFHLIGVPEADMEQVSQWVDARRELLFTRSPERQLACAHSLLAYHQYLRTLIEQRQVVPQDDFLSDFIQSAKEEQPNITMPQQVRMLSDLIAAGVETALNLIGNCLHFLLTERSYWQALQNDPDLLPKLVEELLRFDGSVTSVFRTTTQEVELGGVTLPKKAVLWIFLNSANHDEALFPHPERFDPHRDNLDRHLAFGGGVHLCLGAPLTRLEVRVALEALSQRLPSLRLVPNQTINYLSGSVLRGVQHLLVEWDTAPAAG